MKRIFLVALLPLWITGILSAQPASGVFVTPSSVTLVVGESRSFRLVDNSGHVIKNVDWAPLDTGIVEVSDNDEVQVTALRIGKVTLRARGGNGSAYAHIEVIAGARPAGTVEWNSGGVAGCRTLRVDQVRVVGNGPGVIVRSECADGVYLNAYSAQGVYLWRSKLHSVSDATANGADATTVQTPSPSMDTRATSICDSISIGMKEEAVAQLMASRQLRPLPREQTMWTIEEDNARCTLWFAAFTVERKRKTLTSD